MRRRNRRYDAAGAAVRRVDAAVISVGNLTLGGVGKTPMVLWLAQWLSARSIPLAIVSRGYGARGGANDEARNWPNDSPACRTCRTPTASPPPKKRSADTPSARSSRDAFQHRRIARDLDIVLLDAFEPFGFGHVFPRGTLREPLEGLRRADLVALSRADFWTRLRGQTSGRVGQIVPHAGWLELAHMPKNCRGKRQAGVVGIACRPAGRRVLRIGYSRRLPTHARTRRLAAVDFREFPDHHAYTPRPGPSGRRAGRHGAEAVLCTRKDLVKLDGDRLGMAPLWAVSVDLEILEGREVLEGRLGQ